MFANYLKIALRKMKKNIGFTFINVTGLAIGMACCILITLWVLNELSYDSFHSNVKNIYGVVFYTNHNGEYYKSNGTPVPLAQAMKEDFPDVIASAKYTSGAQQVVLAREDKSFYENAVSFADQSFLNMFSFPLVNGDVKSALVNPFSIVISENLAKKYFGDENPLGKTLRLNNNTDLVVTGIMKKYPGNSTLKFDVLISYGTLLSIDQYSYSPAEWANNSGQTFIQLNEKASIYDLNTKLKDYVRKKRNENRAPEYTTVSLKDMHFSPYYGGGGNMISIYIFSVVAFIILLIACINFMNLSTISSARRAMEIGLRKVVGATRQNTVVQFLGEFFLLASISLLIAFLLVVFLLPLFNTQFGKELELGMLFNGSTIIALTGILIFTAFLGGGYPALIISSLKPAAILKGKSGSGLRKTLTRRFLVVFQFFLSVTLIIVMSVIYSQYDYMRNQNPGFDKGQVMYMRLKAGTSGNYQSLKNAIAGNPGIVNIMGASDLPTFLGNRTSDISWTGKNAKDESLVHYGNVDYDYFKTLKIGMADGKEFSKESLSDSREGIIINEEMVKRMGRNNVVGEFITWERNKYKIIGVMKDFHNVSMNEKIPPLVFTLLDDASGLPKPAFQIIKLSSGNIASTINFVKAKWNEINPSIPFEYHFLDEEFDKMYKSEEKLSSIIGGFSLIAVFISALGLFGLASYTAELRKKEIAIRKVLGSTVKNVLSLLLKEYFYLVFIANIIAWPLGYYITHKWIEDYAYKIDIGLGIYVITGIAALLIAVISVGYQSVKAALVNPADNLRSE